MRKKSVLRISVFAVLLCMMTILCVSADDDSAAVSKAVETILNDTDEYTYTMYPAADTDDVVEYVKNKVTNILANASIDDTVDCEFELDENVDRDDNIYKVALSVTKNLPFYTVNIDVKITHLADLTPTVKGSQRRADGTPGLRFGFAYDNTLDKSGYDENSVSYGAVVIPAAFAESLNITLNTENVADVPAVNLYDTTDESEYIYTAVVKNIPDGTGDDGYDAANTDIIAAPYVKYAIDGTRYVVYGNSIVRNWIAANYGFGSLGYAPYKYVYVITKVNNTIVVDQEGRIETVYNINKADDTTAFDQESGTTETVYKLNVCMNGKVTTIPTAIDYGSGVNWASYQMQLATVTDIKDGKYVLKPCAHMKDAYDTTSQEGHEINVAGGRLTYDGYTKTYEITYNGKTYTTLLDADSEFYVQTNKDGIYDSIKCYTMDNPYTSLGNVWLSDGIIKVNYGSNGKPVSYTLVVAYTCTSS